MCEYPITGRVAGEECSSTYEGRHITVLESELIHPYHSDGLVDKGDPVIVGDPTTGAVIVGVAFKSAAAATDLIAIDTEGIWFLNVLGIDSDGTNDGHAHALALGDPIYIKRAAGTVGAPYMLSGQDNPEDFLPFGYVLGAVAASTPATPTDPTLVAVKVHWHPNYLESINVGTLTLVNQVNVISNLEVDISTFRTGGEVQESWGIEFAWMKCFVGLANALHVDEDMCGIYMRLENDKHCTGGDLYAGRFQTHVNHVDCVLTRAYGLYVAISLEGMASLAESIGVSINMGGVPGATPAMQTAIQIMGDGTLGTRQSWFQTEIGRGAGLKAETTNVTTKTHEIPININGTIYAIPVIPWI
jgi:hypothetical protein